MFNDVKLNLNLKLLMVIKASWSVSSNNLQQFIEPFSSSDSINLSVHKLANKLRTWIFTHKY
jgi:hypothetical protein